MKKILAITAALILLCGCACAGYTGENQYLILFEDWLTRCGYDNLLAQLEVNGNFLYAESGMAIYILTDNGVPYTCTVESHAATDADVLLVASAASCAFAGGFHDPTSAYMEYLRNGEGYGSFVDGWCYLIKKNSDGHFTCHFMNQQR